MVITLGMLMTLINVIAAMVSRILDGTTPTRRTSRISLNVFKTSVYVCLFDRLFDIIRYQKIILL